MTEQTSAAQREAERRWDSRDDRIASDFTYPGDALREHMRGAFVAGAAWNAEQTPTVSVEDVAEVLTAHGHCVPEYIDGKWTGRLTCGLPVPDLHGPATFRSAHRAEQVHALYQRKDER